MVPYQLQLNGEITRTNDGRDFLVGDTGEQDENRIIAFGSVGNLIQLTESDVVMGFLYIVHNRSQYL